MHIHYRNRHGGTNLPWQTAFMEYGKLSVGSVLSGGFPDNIDHLHLGGSCKGRYSGVQVPILSHEVKKVQENTGCSVSVFFGDTQPERFDFHLSLLISNIPKLQIYSASLYGTPQWRQEVNWVLHPTEFLYGA